MEDGLFYSVIPQTSPVCTTEFVAFQKRYEEFQKLQCDLIGLSIDYTCIKYEAKLILKYN